MNRYWLVVALGLSIPGPAFATEPTVSHAEDLEKQLKEQYQKTFKVVDDMMKVMEPIVGNNGALAKAAGLKSSAKDGTTLKPKLDAAIAEWDKAYSAAAEKIDGDKGLKKTFSDLTKEEVITRFGRELDTLRDDLKPEPDWVDKCRVSPTDAVSGDCLVGCADYNSSFGRYTRGSESFQNYKTAVANNGAIKKVIDGLSDALKGKGSKSFGPKEGGSFLDQMQKLSDSLKPDAPTPAATPKPLDEQLEAIIASYRPTTETIYDPLNNNSNAKRKEINDKIGNADRLAPQGTLTCNTR